MNRRIWTSLGSAVLVAAALSACSDKNSPSLINDTEVKAELASSAGDAMAIAVATMVGNEASASLSDAAPPPGGSNLNDGSLSYSRSRVCYDASNVVVAGCSPLASVRTIVTHVQLDGSRSGSKDDGKSWSAAVHRTSDDSLTRVFASGTETQRVHNDDATASDSVTATAPDKSFFFSSNGVDSVKAVTFNLPRSSNPWPVSGSLVRRAAVNAVVTKGTDTESKSYTFRIEVTFPADAQGNVALKINTTTCNLNLVTHAVTACVTP